MNLYIARGGESLGPYNELQAREYLKAGIFAPDDLSCLEGDESWKPLSTRFPATSPTPLKLPAAVQPAAAPAASINPARSTPLVAIFLTVFGAIVLGGGTLLTGWHYVLGRQSSAPALAVPVASSGQSSLFASKGRIDGEVFIATKGGTAYKLAAVRISVYPLEKIAPSLAATKEQVDRDMATIGPEVRAARENADQKDKTAQYGYDDAAHSSYIAALEKEGAARAATRYFKELPAPEIVAETNSEGKFAVETPQRGTYALVVSAHRSVGDKTEYYHWAVKVDLEGADQKSVMLSNNNLVSQDASDSLINAEE